jgi:hypothetical protein
MPGYPASSSLFFRLPRSSSSSSSILPVPFSIASSLDQPPEAYFSSVFSRFPSLARSHGYQDLLRHQICRSVGPEYSYVQSLYYSFLASTSVSVFACLLRVLSMLFPICLFLVDAIGTFFILALMEELPLYCPLLRALSAQLSFYFPVRFSLLTTYPALQLRRSG